MPWVLIVGFGYFEDVVVGGPYSVLDYYLDPYFAPHCCLGLLPALVQTVYLVLVEEASVENFAGR